MKETYLVAVTRPEGVSVASMKDHIQSAVKNWGYGGNPLSPEWHIGDNAVVVTRKKK